MKNKPIQQLSNQEIFNIVWERAKDKRKATKGVWGCAYRAKQPDGEVLKCFIGACIPDSMYEPKMEGAIEFLLLGYPALGFLYPQAGFLAALQSIHDKALPDEWEQRLRLTADKYKLTIPE